MILPILNTELSRFYHTVLEKMIITGMGSAAAAVVSGAVFTPLARYILHLDLHPVQTIFVCLTGGRLGILFLIAPSQTFAPNHQHHHRNGLSVRPLLTKRSSRKSL